METRANKEYKKMVRTLMLPEKRMIREIFERIRKLRNLFLGFLCKFIHGGFTGMLISSLIFIGIGAIVTHLGGIFDETVSSLTRIWFIVGLVGTIITAPLAWSTRFKFNQPVEIQEEEEYYEQGLEDN